MEKENEPWDISEKDNIFLLNIHDNNNNGDDDITRDFSKQQTTIPKK